MNLCTLLIQYFTSNLTHYFQQQEEKIKRLLHEEESLKKDVGLEEDKLTSLLLSLISRENRYAQSVLDLMKIKQQFYKNAFETISVEIPHIEGVLKETQTRPMFGEDIEDHLRATKRTIAFPIALAVSFLRDTDLSDEGLFRISTKQIKLDKLKAYLDANLPFITLLQVWFFFAVIQILREIIFGESRSSITVVFAILGALNLVLLVLFSLQKVQNVSYIKIQSL